MAAKYTMSELHRIAQLRAAGFSASAIAKQLGRSTAAIYHQFASMQIERAPKDETSELVLGLLSVGLDPVECSHVTREQVETIQRQHAGENHRERIERLRGILRDTVPVKEFARRWGISPTYLYRLLQ
jgi:AcrR family transcriptional regulator